MAQFKKVQLELDHKFDPRSSRHFINGFQTVFHCHHYTTLYTQLALDAGETMLLQNVSEESFYNVLNDYYQKHQLTTIVDKIEIAVQYYSALGLGNIEVVFLGNDSAEIKSASSHVELGWIKKWGKYDKSVNYIGCGFVAAMCSAILEKPIGIFEVNEIKSIVKGDAFTLFKVVKK